MKEQQATIISIIKKLLKSKLFSRMFIASLNTSCMRPIVVRAYETRSTTKDFDGKVSRERFSAPMYNVELLRTFKKERKPYFDYTKNQIQYYTRESRE